MSRTWAAIDVGIRFDPGTLRLGRALGIDGAELWLLRLTCWLKVYSPQHGQVQGNEGDIELAIGWKFTMPLLEALQAARLLDDKGRLEGWWDLNGWLWLRGEKDRLRKQKGQLRKKPRKPPRKPARPTNGVHLPPAHSNTDPMRAKERGTS